MCRSFFFDGWLAAASQGVRIAHDGVSALTPITGLPEDRHNRGSGIASMRGFDLAVKDAPRRGRVVHCRSSGKPLIGV
jgi:hypothetical protein